MSWRSRIDFYGVMEHARRVKLAASARAKKYSQGVYTELIERAREVWGSVPSYLYDDVPAKPDSYSKTVLAALIAERVALRLEKNLWKHLTVLIVGIGGSGKTTYAVLSAIGALRLLFPDADAEEMVSALTFFESQEFVRTVEAMVKQKRWAPVIVLDDVGSQITKYWIMIGQHYLAYLFSVLDQLKDLTPVLILTARSFTSVPARLRELTDIVVEASEVDLGGTVLDAFMFYYYNTYVSNKRVPVFVDAMPPSIRMSDRFWQKMLEARRKTAMARLETVREFMEAWPELEKEKIRKLKKRLGGDKDVDGEA